jgi:hypothetical protein
LARDGACVFPLEQRIELAGEVLGKTCPQTQTRKVLFSAMRGNPPSRSVDLIDLLLHVEGPASYPGGQFYFA